MPENTIESQPAAAGRTGWARRFLVNVFWTWVGVFATFLTGFIVSPYIVRALGDTRYGIWALAFSFMEYFALVDFGFKSAAVTLISRHRAANDDEAVNEVINTSLFYFAAIGGALLAVLLALAGELHRLFHIPPEYHADFAAVVRTVATGWAVGIALNVNQAVLEAFQLFRTQNRIWISGLLLRSAGCIAVLYLGYGLVAIAVVTMLGQLWVQALSFASVARAFPGLRIAPRYVKIAVWKEMAGYGVHAFGAYIGGMLFSQGPPVVIGAMRPAAFVGYYTLPVRLLQYAGDLVTRIGYVTVPNTAEMMARGETREIARTTAALNRYCFALFAPCAVFLLVWGRELIAVWVKPGFADQAAPLLPPIVLSTTLAIAAQYNAVAALFGMARHKRYSQSLLAEGVLALAGIAAGLYVSGLAAAAWIAASLTLLNRGLFTAVLFCRAVGERLASYLARVYAAPLLLTVPVGALAWWLKAGGWLAGRNWFEVIAAAAVTGSVYYMAGWFAVIEAEHRAVLTGWAARVWGRRLRRAGA